MGSTGVFAGENPDAIWEKDSKYVIIHPSPLLPQSYQR